MTADAAGPPPAAGDSPGFLLNQATLALNGALDRALAPAGLTGAQWTAVYVLHEGRATNASEVARALGQDVAATWRLVGRLIDKGYVERTPDLDDGRVVRLALTGTARAEYARWRAVVAATVADAFEGVPTEDLAVLTRSLARVVRNQRARASGTARPTPP